MQFDCKFFKKMHSKFYKKISKRKYFFNIKLEYGARGNRVSGSHAGAYCGIRASEPVNPVVLAFIALVFAQHFDWSRAFAWRKWRSEIEKNSILAV